MRLSLFASIFTLSLAVPVYARPLDPDSEIFIDGTDGTFDSTTLTLPTSNVNQATGNFALPPLHAFGTCTSCVNTANPFTWSPFTPGLLFTALSNGQALSVSVTSFIDTSFGANYLRFSDLGIVNLTGFDPTTAHINVNIVNGIITEDIITTQSFTGVPEPGTLAILGFGLIGLGAAKRLTSHS
jgi:hypothetical protein